VSFAFFATLLLDDGWPARPKTLLIITLGKYPRGEYLKKHRDRISAVGLIIVILVWVIIAAFNSYSLAGA